MSRSNATSPSWAVRATALILGLAAAIGFVELASRVVFPQWQDFATERFLHPIDVPGYVSFAVGRPGFDGYFAQNNGDFRIHLRINDFGLRNDEPVTAADGRLWAIGDSFTFGWGVERSEIFAQVAADRLGQSSYNLASPGTNVCGYQALVDRMPKPLHPGAVVVGLTLENDIHDYQGCPPPAAEAVPAPADSGWSMMRLKGLLTNHSAAYNFLAVSLKRLDALTQVLTAAGFLEKIHVDHSGQRQDALPRTTASTADELAKLRAILPPRTAFAVVLIPGRTEIGAGDPLYRTLRQMMTEALQARGITVLDPFPQLQALGLTSAHFQHDGHWSPKGHAVAGEMVATWLSTLNKQESRR